jgi:hypothetical protein
MKQIQPVTVWYNGQEVQATVLNAYGQSDNLLNQAVFPYSIGNVSADAAFLLKPLVSGSLIMTGQAYLDWQTNQYAWDWIASQLNLTIIGDVTTTTTSTTTTEAPSTTTTTLIS